MRVLYKKMKKPTHTTECNFSGSVTAVSLAQKLLHFSAKSDVLWGPNKQTA